jgi:hypothetical protein
MQSKNCFHQALFEEAERNHEEEYCKENLLRIEKEDWDAVVESYQEEE